jgi:hypothetical protein
MGFNSAFEVLNNVISMANLYVNYRLPRESPEKLFVARLQISTALISRVVSCLDTTLSVTFIFNTLKPLTLNPPTWKIW